MNAKIALLPLSLLVASPGFAGLSPVDATLWLEIDGLAAVELASARGVARATPGGEAWSLPPLSFDEGICASFPLSGLSPLSAVKIEPSGISPGTIRPGVPAGGRLRLRGSFVVRLSSGSLGDLTVPLSAGAPASPATGIAVASPAASQTTFASLTASFSSWGSASTLLSQTENGQITTTRSTAGLPARPTPSGGRVVTLVSPMHIYVAHSEGDFSADVRTIAGTARLRLTLPEPTSFALQLFAVAALWSVGAWRQAASRARAGRRAEP